MSRYIDADAFKEDVKHHLSVLAYAGSHAIKLGTLEQWLDNTPSIDIEPKRGEWLEWIDCEGEVFWKCSACGQVSEASAAGILYKFCPFCGADMREREGE